MNVSDYNLFVNSIYCSGLSTVILSFLKHERDFANVSDRPTFLDCFSAFLVLKMSQTFRVVHANCQEWSVNGCSGRKFERRRSNVLERILKNVHVNAFRNKRITLLLKIIHIFALKSQINFICLHIISEAFDDSYLFEEDLKTLRKVHVSEFYLKTYLKI